MPILKFLYFVVLAHCILNCKVATASTPVITCKVTENGSILPGNAELEVDTLSVNYGGSENRQLVIRSPLLARHFGFRLNDRGEFIIVGFSNSNGLFVAGSYFFTQVTGSDYSQGYRLAHYQDNFGKASPSLLREFVFKNCQHH